MPSPAGTVALSCWLMKQIAFSEVKFKRPEMLRVTNVWQGFGGPADVHHARCSERRIRAGPRQGGAPSPAPHHHSVHPGAARIGPSGNDATSGRQVRNS